MVSSYHLIFNNGYLQTKRKNSWKFNSRLLQTSATPPQHTTESRKEGRKEGGNEGGLAGLEEKGLWLACWENAAGLWEAPSSAKETSSKKASRQEERSTADLFKVVTERIGAIGSERATQEGPFIPQSDVIHTSRTKIDAPQKVCIHFSGSSVGPIINRNESLINRCCFAPGRMQKNLTRFLENLRM